MTLNEVVTKFQTELMNRKSHELHRECLYVMGFNAKSEAIYVEMAAIGTIIYHQPIIRECLRSALRQDAIGIIVAHNHPSGDPTPSLGDCTFTQALKEACQVVDLNLIDHLILGDPGVYSMSRDGGLNTNLNQIKYGS